MRIEDNSALAAACEDESAEIVALFIATPGQWQQHDMAPIRQDFILRNVGALAKALEDIGIALLYREVNDFADVPALLSELVTELGIDTVYANREYGYNEKQRDLAVIETLQSVACDTQWFHDQSMLPPGLETKTGKPYTVYTPFKKRWLESWRALRPALRPTPARRCRVTTSDSQALELPRNAEHDGLWPAGSAAALARLQAFCDQRIADYQLKRDIPMVNGTSVISPWLAAGVLSTRQCLEYALAGNHGMLSGGKQGIDCWISELIWRDFYIHILDSFPDVSKHQAFKGYTEFVAWRSESRDFEAWCQGRTGIPIVDAAMRQLLQTGWMHNRLRMVVAMFLSKTLLIDWRMGERFFMQHLIDGHLAANNGGWQWAASTGTDAVPYFRIFNPVSQSKRFDKDGDFIRHYVPELAQVSARDIHLPPANIRQTLAPDYPAPVVDLKFGRLRALDAFASAKSLAAVE